MSVVPSKPTPQQIFQWWNWALSIPDRPSSPHPGKGGNIDQNQPVDFFCHVCTFGTGRDLNRKYNVGNNAKKPILVPVLTSEASKAENPGLDDAQLLNKAKNDLQNPRILFLAVDDAYVLTPQNAQQFYVESDAGDVTPVAENVLGLPNERTRMRCIGYFVLLSNFGPGKHDITFGGSAGPANDRIETLIRYEVNF